MGMLLLLCAAGLYLLGWVVGALVGSGFRAPAAGGRVGGIMFALVGGILVYFGLFAEVSSHGYPNRDAYCKAESEARCEQLAPLAAALEKYKADKGRYPEQLQELVAGKYLDALPSQALTVDHQGQPDRLG